MTYRPGHKWLEFNGHTSYLFKSSDTMLYVGQKMHSYEKNFITGKILTASDFGAVYKVRDYPDHKQKFALKLEYKMYVREKKGIQVQMNRLKNEVAVYESIHKAANAGNKSPFLKFIDQGESNEFYFMVVSLAGYSIRDIRKLKMGVISAPSTVYIARKSLEAIEALHSVGYVHGDIKPMNFLVGFPPNEKMIYMVDFAMAEQYREHGKKTRKARIRNGHVGTERYWSRAFHEQKEPYQVDDIESWCYMITELFDQRKLSWFETRDPTELFKQKNKFMTDLRTLLRDGFYRIPSRFVDVIEYVEKMMIEGALNYSKIHKLIDQLVQEENIDEKATLDWIGIKTTWDNAPTPEMLRLRKQKQMERKEREAKEKEKKNSERERKKTQAIIRRESIEQKLIKAYADMGKKKSLEEIRIEMRKLAKKKTETQTEDSLFDETSQDFEDAEARKKAKDGVEKERRKKCSEPPNSKEKKSK